jgi:TonB family protein
LQKSSGFPQLDAAALALLEAAARQVPLPAALAAEDFSLAVPVMFRLDAP